MKLLQVTDCIDLPHPAAAAYQALADLEAYSQWWPAPFAFRFLGPKPLGVGSRLQAQHGPLIRWVATLEQLEVGRRVGFGYSGAWEGQTAWLVEPLGPSSCRVCYRIEIVPGPLWLRLLGRVAPLEALHSQQMQRVFAALQQRLAHSCAEVAG